MSGDVGCRSMRTGCLGARLSHREDRDLFEMHIKACFSMAGPTRGAK